MYSLTTSFGRLVATSVITRQWLPLFANLATSFNMVLSPSRSSCPPMMIRLPFGFFCTLISPFRACALAAPLSLLLAQVFVLAAPRHAPVLEEVTAAGEDLGDLHARLVDDQNVRVHLLGQAALALQLEGRRRVGREVGQDLLHG